MICRGILGFLCMWLIGSFGYLHLVAHHILPGDDGASHHTGLSWRHERNENHSLREACLEALWMNCNSYFCLQLLREPPSLPQPLQTFPQ